MANFWAALQKLQLELVMAEEMTQLEALYKGESAVFTRQGLTNCHGAGFTNKHKQDVVALIEATLLGVIETIARGEAPSLSYPRRDIWQNVRYQEGRGLEMIDQPSETTLRFDSLNTIKRFTLTIKLLSTIHRLVQTDTYCTKRDLFYQDPQMFGSQTCVDTIIDNISCMLRVPRHSLHVLATSKGLVCGDLRYVDVDGNLVDCSAVGTMVPARVEAIKNLHSNARFVLLVEKDATYQRLIEQQLCHKLAPCILITAKGFPDVNTRVLVRRIWDDLKIPILGLVDADPHGVEILMVYKFGSLSLSHDAASMTTPSIRWLGVRPSDVSSLNLPSASLIPLAENDKKRAKELMHRPYITAVPKWKTELDIMLQVGAKAEIQCLDSLSPQFLTDIYLPNKILFGDWI